MVVCYNSFAQILASNLTGILDNHVVFVVASNMKAKCGLVAKEER